jgi:hypothetical protein
MPRQTTTYRVLIASPSDCEEERRLVPEVISDWVDGHSLSLDITVLPVKWETNSVPELGEKGARPQGIINSQLIKDSDILVAIFWSRLGTPTGKADSGTIEEIEEFRKAGRPVLVYFSQKPVPNNVDTSQLEKLREYREQIRHEGICFDYHSLENLRNLLSKHLNRVITELHEVHKLSLKNPVNAEPMDERLKRFREFADEFDSFLRGFELKWHAEQEVRQINLNNGKSHLLSAYDHVHTLTSRIKFGLDEIKEPLKEILVKIRQLQDHHLFADGGRSMAEFWEHGNEIIKDLHGISGKIRVLERRLLEPQSEIPPNAHPTDRGVSLSELAAEIIREAVKDKNGMILAYGLLDGWHVATNQLDFVEPDDPRSEAKARAAIKELQANGLIEQRGKESYGVTAAGFDWTDKQNP